MMSYINETDFVIENMKLVYPEIVTDGLQLYYDAKGKRDTDYHRDTMLDMSGNKNHGKLHNFAYEKHSGYKDGLVFDYIDDKLVRPTLDLKPNDFTFMLNGNIISFSSDGTVKRVQDGEVIESKGFNLVRNGDFNLTSHVEWASNTNIEHVIENNEVTIIGKGSPRSTGGNWFRFNKINEPYSESIYYITALAKGQGQAYIGVSYNTTNMNLNDSFSRVSYFGKHETNNNTNGYAVLGGNLNDTVTFKEVVAIDLTETFGAGNEPTKEQMDEIINRFGFIHNAKDLTDRIEYRGNELGDMENIIDGLYKTEALSGEEIYTDKADDDAGIHVEVDGKSVGGGSGKNLFDIRMIDESITGAGSTVGAPIKLNPNTTYTLSTNAIPTSTMRDVFFDINRIGPSSNINGVKTTGLATITTDSSGDAIVWLRASNSTNEYNVDDFREGTNWIQIEEGTTATTYEPPAPTPDYPIAIHSLNDFGVVSSVSKRNLLPNSHFDEVDNLNGHKILYGKGGVEDSKLRISITTARVSSRVEKGFYLNETGTFTYSIYAKVNTQIQWRGHVGVKAETKYEPSQDDFSVYSFTFTNYEPGLKTIRGYFGNEIGDFIEIEWEKLEKGNKATYWTPATEDITESDNHLLIDKINLLLSEPLRSLGDVKDRLFRDNDGVWKIERNVAEGYADGSENWVYQSSYGRFDSLTNFLPISGVNTNASPNYNTINSHYSFDGVANARKGYFTWVVGRAPRVVHGDMTSASELKTFIKSQYDKGTPVTWVYQIEKTIEVLEQELQDKLNNLRSFEDSNYVYTVEGSTNLLDTVPLLNSHWYPSSGILQNPVAQNGHTSTQEPLPVYPGVKINLIKETTVDNYWRIVWVDKNNNVVRREVSTVNDLVLTAPNGAYGMRVSYPNGSNPVIKFDKSDISQAVSNNLKPTLHAKFLYNNWYKEDRVINNLMIYNRALTNEEMLQNYKTIKRRWGM